MTEQYPLVSQRNLNLSRVPSVQHSPRDKTHASKPMFKTTISRFWSAETVPWPDMPLLGHEPRPNLQCSRVRSLPIFDFVTVRAYSLWACMSIFPPLFRPRGGSLYCYPSLPPVPPSWIHAWMHACPHARVLEYVCWGPPPCFGLYGVNARTVQTRKTTKSYCWP